MPNPGDDRKEKIDRLISITSIVIPPLSLYIPDKLRLIHVFW